MNERERAEVTEAAREADPVAIARLLVATPSVNPSLSEGGQGERQVAEVAADLLSVWGLDVDMVDVAPGRTNVVGRLEGRGPTLVFNGHLDTVGVEGMTVDPFAARILNDRLIGRGACDMKGGVASLLAATARMARGGARPNVLVALTADEEHASIGMEAFVRSGARADFAVVCEPTGLDVMPAHKGFVWLEARFRGRAAHGSRPDIGVDAIRHAALYLSALDGYTTELRKRPLHPLLGHGSFHAGRIEGGTAESVYPEHCDLRLERRTMPGETPATVLEEFQGVLSELRSVEPGLEASLSTTLDRPGTEVPTDSPLVEGLMAAGAEHGAPGSIRGMTAWVDAAFLNEAGIPAVCYGPGSIEQAHTPDEWIEVAQIETCTNVLETFARGLVD